MRKTQLKEEETLKHITPEHIKKLAVSIGKDLIQYLRGNGEEIRETKVKNIKETSFTVHVKYANNFEDDYKFKLENKAIFLVNLEEPVELSPILKKPSGNITYNRALLQNKLNSGIFKLNEQSEKAENYLRLLDKYKKASPDERSKIEKKLTRAAKDLGINLDLRNTKKSLEENCNCRKHTQYNTKERKQIKETSEETGLLLYTSSKNDKSEVESIIDKLGLHAEYSPREGYWFLPEEEDMFDSLESILQKEFDRKGINVRMEGQFSESRKKPVSIKEYYLNKQVNNVKAEGLNNITLPKGTKIYQTPSNIYAQHKQISEILKPHSKTKWHDQFGLVLTQKGKNANRTKQHLKEDFNPNIAAGSTYAIQVEKIDNSKVKLSQDNGEELVVHMENVPDLVERLNFIYKK